MIAESVLQIPAEATDFAQEDAAGQGARLGFTARRGKGSREPRSATAVIGAPSSL